MYTIVYDMRLSSETIADQKERLAYLIKGATEGYVFLDKSYKCGESPEKRQSAFDAIRVDKGDVLRVHTLYHLCACIGDLRELKEVVTNLGITIKFQEKESNALWKNIDAFSHVYDGFMKRQTAKAGSAARVKNLVNMGPPRGIRDLEKAKRVYTSFIKNTGKMQRQQLFKMSGCKSWETYYKYVRVGALLFAQDESEVDPFNSRESLKENVSEYYWNLYYGKEVK